MWELRAVAPGLQNTEHRVCKKASSFCASTGKTVNDILFYAQFHDSMRTKISDEQ